MGRAKYVFSYNMRQNRCIYTKTREVCTQRRSSPRLQPILLFNAIHCFQVSPFLCCQKTLRNSPMECGVSPSVGLNRAPVWRKIPLTLSHFLGWKAAATPAALKLMQWKIKGTLFCTSECCHLRSQQEMHRTTTQEITKYFYYEASRN